MTQIGFMPLLRAGDDVTTAVLLYREMVDSIEASGNALYGTHMKRRSALGVGAGKLSKTLFGNSVSPRDILERHTLFGVYATAMATSVADTLAHRLIAGEPFAFRWAFRGHRRRDILPLAYRTMRVCLVCVRNDVDLQGFAAWRVLHQIPAVGHCPEHGDALRDDSTGATHKSHRSWPRKLPEENSLGPITPLADTLEMSDGYADYLKLWQEAFEQNLIGIKPDLWMLVMDAVVRHFGTISDACAAIHRAIEKSWGLPIDDVASKLRLPDGPSFVRYELEQKIQASYVASRLVICGALDLLGLSPPRKNSSPIHSYITLNEPLPFGSWISPVTQRELRRWVMDGNFPPALFRAMPKDLDVYSLAEVAQIDRIILKKFIRTMPDHLLYRMSKEQSWDHSSWLSQEIVRREFSW